MVTANLEVFININMKDVWKEATNMFQVSLEELFYVHTD